MSTAGFATGGRKPNLKSKRTVRGTVWYCKQTRSQNIYAHIRTNTHQKEHRITNNAILLLFTKMKTHLIHPLVLLTLLMVLPQRAGAAGWAFINAVFCNIPILNWFLCDDCMHQVPCLNDGVCTQTAYGFGNGYECDCTGTGFEGPTCAININDCKSNSCKNGGTCIDDINAFSCECTLPYKGDTCEECQFGFGKEKTSPFKCKLIKDNNIGTAIKEWTVTGNGQKNGEFTVLEAFGVEIAVRAFEVNVGPYDAKASTRGDHTTCGLYEVDAGSFSFSGKALWNIDYSVNLQDGSGVFEGIELTDFDNALLTFECVSGVCTATPDRVSIDLQGLSGRSTFKQDSLVPTDKFSSFDPEISGAIYEVCLELDPDFLDDDPLKVCADFWAEL